MILIAIPKSASTTLIKTLNNLHPEINCKQIMMTKNKKIQEINYLDKFHSDMRELTSKDIKLFTNKKTIYKQHIFPSKNNLKLLNNHKKIILLRHPID
ncbi:MAG: hypothetical protein ACOCP8_06095, partial [archaeon]